MKNEMKRRGEHLVKCRKLLKFICTECVDWETKKLLDCNNDRNFASAVIMRNNNQ